MHHVAGDSRACLCKRGVFAFSVQAAQPARKFTCHACVTTKHEARTHCTQAIWIEMPAAVGVSTFVREHGGTGSIYLGYVTTIWRGRARIRHLARALCAVRMPRLMFVLVGVDVPTMCDHVVQPAPV